MSSLRPIPLPAYQLRGISRRQIEEHYRLYRKYVDKLGEIRQLLSGVNRSDANPNYDSFRELKVEEGFTCDAALLHELYFLNLGGPGGPPATGLLARIACDYGTYDSWEADFVSTGKAARGWAILYWDCAAGRLGNCLSDAHNLGAIWEAIPLLVLDVYEHAYFLDYATDRAAYIQAFMSNVNWGEVSRRFALVASQPAPAAPARPLQPAPPLPPASPASPGLVSAAEARSSSGSLPYPYNLRPRWPV